MKNNYTFKDSSKSLVTVAIKYILKDTLLFLDTPLKGREGEF